MIDDSMPPVRQLRLVVAVQDFDAAVEFYRDVLGLTEQAAFVGDGDARVVILQAGEATLELANAAQVRMIDGVEAEGRPSERLRVAFEVDDAALVTAALVEGGADLVAAPRETPWRSLNSRLHAPGDLQLTVFQELAGPAAPGHAVLRTWTGWIRTADRDAYRAYLERTGLREYRSTAGNLGASVVYRDLADGRTEVRTLSYWRSRADITAFTGEDIEQAVFYPEDDDFLVDRETTVAHFDVVWDDAVTRSGRG